MIRVLKTCWKWQRAGLGNDRFWEDWPECPTRDESMSAVQVINAVMTAGLLGAAVGFVAGVALVWGALL